MDASIAPIGMASTPPSAAGRTAAASTTLPPPATPSPASGGGLTPSTTAASDALAVPGQKRKRGVSSESSSHARSRAFQRSHARKFALEVVARDEETGAVSAALCLFCKHFGREARPGKKRKPTAHFKYFRQSFRTDLYVQHHTSQHPTLWAQYDALADDDKRKRSFFPAASSTEGSDATTSGPTADRLPLLHDKDVADAAAAARSSPDQSKLWFEVNAAIIDLLTPKDWNPRSFRACSRGTSSSTVRTSSGPSVYRVGLFSRDLLELAVDQQAAGLSPVQAACSLAAAAKRATSLPTLSATDLADLARLSVAVSLQRLGTLLANAWGFSLELRTIRAASMAGIERQGDAMLEVRVSVYSERAEEIQDLHLVAFPDALAHSVAVLGADVMSLLDAMLGPSWCVRVIGVAADGVGAEDIGAQLAAWLTDHVRLLTSPKAPLTRTLPVRAWVAAPHLHRVLQAFYSSLLDGDFLPTWRRLVAHIQEEPALIQEMGRPPSALWASFASSCAANTFASPYNNQQWLDMGRDAKWVTDKRVRLRKVLDERHAPPDAWWVAFFVVNWLAGRADDAFERLSRRPQTAAAALADLAAEVATAFRAQPPAEDVEPDADFHVSRSGQYVVTVSSVREFVDDLGLFVSNLAAHVDASTLAQVLSGVAQGVADLVDTLVDLSGGGIEAQGELTLPVTPAELAALSGRELAARLAPLSALFGDDEEAMDAVDQEHQALRRAAAKLGLGTVAPAASDASMARMSSFARAWATSDGRFPRLQAFAGAVATASIASGRLGDLWERGLAVSGRCYGSNAVEQEEDALLRLGGLADVTDLATEASLHALQFARLEELMAPEMKGESDDER